jgi:hypothetical protein
MLFQWFGGFAHRKEDNLTNLLECARWQRSQRVPGRSFPADSLPARPLPTLILSEGSQGVRGSRVSIVADVAHPAVTRLDVVA